MLGSWGGGFQEILTLTRAQARLFHPEPRCCPAQALGVEDRGRMSRWGLFLGEASLRASRQPLPLCLCCPGCAEAAMSGLLRWLPVGCF